MNEKNEGRSFIHEKIVPRKKHKKIIAAVFGTIGLAVLFGAVSGLVFFVSQNALGANAETPAPTIIIARDDTSEEEESTEEEETETSSETAEESASEKEENTSEEPSSPESTESEETSESTEVSVSSETAETAEIQESIQQPNTKKPENSVKNVYDRVSGGIVPVVIQRSNGTDWFNKEIIERIDTFAVLFAQSNESVFALMESEDGMEQAAVTLNVNGNQVKGEVYQQDNLQHICVLKIDRASIQGTPQLVTLGDSTSLIVADDVFMIGAPMGKVIGVDGGIITYYEPYEDIIDGYQQLFYTNMVRSQNGTAALLNRYGQLVGWVSDVSCGVQGTMVIARGLSPMKYLIEDMCSGVDTGYLGVKCIPIEKTDTEDSGMPAGLYVQEVIQDSPAYLSGLQTGDRILSVNGKSVADSHILQLRLDELRPEEKAEVEIERYNGENYVPMTIYVTLGRR